MYAHTMRAQSTDCPRKVWIHDLRSAIHGLRKSMLCAQHIHSFGYCTAFFKMIKLFLITNSVEHGVSLRTVLKYLLQGVYYICLMCIVVLFSYILRFLYFPQMELFRRPITAKSENVVIFAKAATALHNFQQLLYTTSSNCSTQLPATALHNFQQLLYTTSSNCSTQLPATALHNFQQLLYTTSSNCSTQFPATALHNFQQLLDTTSSNCSTQFSATALHNFQQLLYTTSSNCSTQLPATAIHNFLCCKEYFLYCSSDFVDGEDGEGKHIPQMSVTCHGT